FQPREHLPRSRPLLRGSVVLRRSAAAQSQLRRWAFLSRRDAGEDGDVAGRASALARVQTARSTGRVGRAGERILRVAPRRIPREWETISVFRYVSWTAPRRGWRVGRLRAPG